MASKNYPVIRTVGLETAAGASPRPQIEVNVEQLMSKVNRRLYRHGRKYEVKVDLDTQAPGIYTVYALSDSWMNDRAFKMAYQMYLENSEDERDRIKDANIARWEDFRTQSGFTGQFAVANPLLYSGPSLAERIQLTAGEFATTFVVDKAGVSKAFTWGAATASRYSILAEYDKAGNAQSSPSTSTGDMPYDDLMADDSATLAGLLQTSGNSPPYDAAGVNAGNPWVKVGELTSTANGQKLSTGYFTAPCGYVLIAGGADGESAVATRYLNLTCKSGDYKGVHAPSMLE